MSLLHRSEREVAGGSAYGALDGVTLVTLVTSPASGFTRVVEAIRSVNKDTVKHTIRVRLSATGPLHYEFDNADVPRDGKFDPVQQGVDEIRLSVGEEITALMDEAMATTNPTWVAAWRDEPIP